MKRSVFYKFIYKFNTFPKLSSFYNGARQVDIKVHIDKQICKNNKEYTLKSQVCVCRVALFNIKRNYKASRIKTT